MSRFRTDLSIKNKIKKIGRLFLGRSFVLMIILLIYPSSTLGYKPDVHEDITNYAINKSSLKLNDVLPQLGFNGGVDQEITGWTSKNIRQWIEYGSSWEDDIGLYLEAPFSSKGAMYNHFFNPLYNIGYYELEGSVRDEKGESLIFHMNDYIANESDWVNRNEWAFQIARELYYAALTGNSTKHQSWKMRDSLKYSLPIFGKENMSLKEREQFFAWTFQSLGHIVHLIQDASVPAHTRNDLHADKKISLFVKGNSEPFEDWTAKNREFEELMQYNGYGSDPWQNWKDYPNIQAQNVFMDTNPYPEKSPAPDPIIQSEGLDQGLAEYSFANFLSQDSIHGYNLPDLNGAVFMEFNPIKQRNLVYLQSNNFNNGGVKHLALCGFLYHFEDPIGLSSGTYNKTVFTIDDPEVHKDYAAKLIPRAVGYSAGLLDYFFRGKLEITAPAAYVYSIVDGSGPQQFTRIKAKLRNTSEDEMGSGTLIAVARYKNRTDYQTDLSTDPPTAASREPDFSYSVSAPISITDLDSVIAEEKIFDFTLDPIPAGITDLYLQVIFKGTLGNETDNAIAVGMKDLNEPEHLVFWNNTDYFLLNGVPRKAEDIENNPDVAAYGYIYPYFFTEQIGFSETTPDALTPVVATIEDLPPARYSRLIVLVDDPDQFWVKDHLTSFLDDYTWEYTFTSAVNQEAADGFWNNTPVYDVRGIVQHQMTYFIRDYPYYIYDPDAFPAPAENALGPYPVTINFP